MIKLKDILPVSRDVASSFFEIVSNSSRVEWRGDGAVELYSRAVDGSGSQLKLNTGLVADGGLSRFAIAPGPGFCVVYLAAQDTDEMFERYSATTDAHGRTATSGNWDDRSNWILLISPEDPNPIETDPAASMTVAGSSMNRTVESLQINGRTGIATLALQNCSILAGSSGVTIQSTVTLS